MQALAASHPDIVPADVLALEAGRGLRAPECATLLDGYLRRLARQEARARRILGRLARGFLAQRGQHALGFARVRDYARERLGLSARELQSLAHVATPENAPYWLVVACLHTVRALEAMVARRAGRRVAGDTIDGEERVRVRLPCPRHVRARWGEVMELARCMCGSELAPWHAAEAIAAEGYSARGVEPDDPLAGLPDLPPAPILEHESRTPMPALDWSALQEALPEDVEALARGAEDLNAFALDRRMRAALRALQRVDFQMGRLLHLLFARRLHRLLGFPTAARYAQERLGLSPRKARALVALDRRSATLPALAAAYHQGEVSWLRALSLLPVVDEGSAAAWVARAQAVTIRRLVDEVEWTLAVRDTGGQAAGPPPLGARLVRPERQVCAHAVDADITFFAPESVAILLRTAIAAFTLPAEPSWRGLERLLDHVHREWSSQPRHRDPIFARDGWRCAVPACTSRRNLHDHHLLFRSRGGGNARDNRITVCAWHHLRGIHQGRVRAWGTAPDAVTWELGTRPGQPPLLTLRGDRYLEVSELMA
ncbi:MAG TPA: HNH endonuclease signature motif containing protein [Verrucomicrobiae bacterium]|nr:HNH endonuclease signature motif containing protein [Verrucomicrobiae bacterium]